MEFSFNYILQDRVPALAWLMKLKKSESGIWVKHGTGVEHKPDFFVSGVWADDFGSGRFDTTAFSCCTGARIAKLAGGGKQLIISTSSHLQDSVIAFSTKDELTISNSLPWLLSDLHLELDENYYEYERDFCSIIFGEKQMMRRIPTKNGDYISLYRNCNLMVDKGLSIREENKCQHQRFKDYTSYTDFLRKVLREIRSNAIDSDRNHRYGMITTISQGYDATATSVLAKELGCNEALTLRVPVDDNGAEIAKDLGYEMVYQIEPDEYLRNKKMLEAETAATFSTAGIYEPYERICAGKLIFMGDRGDSVWERGHVNVNPYFDFHAGNGFSQASLFPVEYLLRVNSIIISVPLIGADSWPEIDKISSSEEMKKWSVADHYDRPIPRRIVESAGIGRECFGRKKIGAGISYHFNTFRSLKNKMSPSSFKSLRCFRKKMRRKLMPLLAANVKFYISEAPVFANYILRRIRIPIRFSSRRTGTASSPLNTMLFLWGINEMQKRYKQ